MMNSIFNEIDTCDSPAMVFDLIADYFQGQGFAGVGYVAPQVFDGPVTIVERGIAPEFVARYRDHLHRIDPLPRLAFRLAQPVLLEDLIANLPSLNAEEQGYLEDLKTSGLTNTLVIPSYGPFGRPSILVLDNPAHPDLVSEMNIPLAAAVAQAMHTRMELLQVGESTPGLSPREREIIGWLCKGKSNTDIATILGVKGPTVTTHIQRIYGKLGVRDRVSACAKASARHYV